MTVPLAHAGHWLAGLLYLAPVAVVVGALGWQRIRDRRAGGPAGKSPRDPLDPPNASSS